ncbi:MAG: hypothetical protein HC763_25950 [Hydrococcus sp. CRU_1_1]|nr:hypothetical protein [Hydrococcus sp. CRU_1_1]
MIWTKSFVPQKELKVDRTSWDAIALHKNEEMMRSLNEFKEEFPENHHVRQRLLGIIEASQVDPVASTAFRLTAMKNYEKKNYRRSLESRLRNLGFPVSMINGSPNKFIGDWYSNCRKGVIDDTSESIFSASDKFVGKSSIVTLSLDSSLSDKRALEKAKLLDRLPDIQLSESWNPEFIKQVKYQNPNLIAQLNRLHLLRNPDVAKEIEKRKWIARHNNRYGFDVWRFDTELLRLKALSAIDILDFIERYDGVELEATDDCVTELIAKAAQYHGVWGKPSKYPIKSIKLLLNNVGFDLEYVSKQRDDEGKDHRKYKITFGDDRTQTCKNDILRSLELKYVRDLEREVKPILIRNNSQSSEVQSELSESSKVICQQLDSSPVKKFKHRHIVSLLYIHNRIMWRRKN